MEPFDFEQFAVSQGAAGPVVLEPGTGATARVLAELEEQRREVLEHARTEGYEAGLAEARAGLAPAAQTLAETLDRLGDAFEERQHVLERRAVELALFVADRVVGEALGVRPELVLSTVAGALRTVAERDRLVVEVNPEDVLLVQGSIDELAGRVGGIHRLEIVGERRVPRGGCVVRTVEGEVDARLGEKLDLAREALVDALRPARDE